MADAPEQNLKAPLRRLTGVQVVSTGSYVPEIVVRNEDLAKYGCEPEWIFELSGIRERRHTPPHMCTSDLAVAASRRAVEKAGVWKPAKTKNRFSPAPTLPWKSRRNGEIPTFPPRR